LKSEINYFENQLILVSSNISLIKRKKEFSNFKLTSKNLSSKFLKESDYWKKEKIENEEREVQSFSLTFFEIKNHSFEDEIWKMMFDFFLVYHKQKFSREGLGIFNELVYILVFESMQRWIT